MRTFICRTGTRCHGSIQFCTTGVVLRQMQSDPYLKTISHLILDEIHERDIMSDFLITLVKKIVRQRKDLKLILMSATLNSQQFSDYFGGCELLHIPGFTHHVEEYYLEDVLEKTGFIFKSPRSQHCNTEAASDFENEIGSYIEEMRAEKKYPQRVITQIANPMSEYENMSLVLEVIVQICRVSWCRDMFMSSCLTVFSRCLQEAEPGAILIFLTGFNEISSLMQNIRFCRDLDRRKYLLLPLHSQMETVEQKKIFETPPNGIRKIILSTNIAETSITIDDVVFVVDCGRIKMSNINVETNLQSLSSQWITVANSVQRKGRAGRVKPGVCYHLFSKWRARSLEPYPKPEILRTRLEDVILTIKMLQLGKAEEFLNLVMDKPDSKVVKTSIELLKRLNALDERENLTPLGYHLAKLPMAPQVGKMILLGE